MKWYKLNANKIRLILIVLVIVAAVYNYVFIAGQKKKQETVTGDTSVPAQTVKKAQPIKEVKEWKTFRDAAAGYELDYPAHWKLEDHSAKDGLIRADLSDGDWAGLQIRVQRNVTSDLKTFADTYLEQFMTDMKEHWKGDIGVIDRGFAQMGKHRGFRAALMMTRGDGQKWFLKQYIRQKGEVTVMFQAGAQAAQIFVYEPLFDKIAGTFIFKE